VKLDRHLQSATAEAAVSVALSMREPADNMSCINVAPAMEITSGTQCSPSAAAASGCFSLQLGHVLLL
jgi:hypothetical protein